MLEQYDEQDPVQYAKMKANVLEALELMDQYMEVFGMKFQNQYYATVKAAGITQDPSQFNV